MTTYAELVTQIRDYTETDNQVLTDTIVNDFIEHAELRIFKDVDLDWIRPDLKEALERKEASHDQNRPDAV